MSTCPKISPCKATLLQWADGRDGRCSRCSEFWNMIFGALTGDFSSSSSGRNTALNSDSAENSSSKRHHHSQTRGQLIKRADGSSDWLKSQLYSSTKKFDPVIFSLSSFATKAIWQGLTLSVPIDSLVSALGQNLLYGPRFWPFRVFFSDWISTLLFSSPVLLLTNKATIL